MHKAKALTHADREKSGTAAQAKVKRDRPERARVDGESEKMMEDSLGGARAAHFIGRDFGSNALWRKERTQLLSVIRYRRIIAYISFVCECGRK